MSWTPVTGTADYSNGKTITFSNGLSGGSPMTNPWLNTSGHQDYGTYTEGESALTITPDTGVANVSAPTKGGQPGGIYE